jgi:hypothetical protein
MDKRGYILERIFIVALTFKRALEFNDNIRCKRVMCVNAVRWLR